MLTFVSHIFPVAVSPSPTILSHNPKEQGSPKRDDRSWTPNNRHATRNRDTNKIQLKTRFAHVPLCWLFFICIFPGVFGACFFRTLFYVHLRSPRHVTNSSVLAPWLKWKKPGESKLVVLVVFWGGGEIPNPFWGGMNYWDERVPY